MLVLKIFIRMQVSGLEQIPKKGAFILAANHRSNLDPVILGVISKRPISYIAKEELFRNKVFGWLLRQLGVIAVKRNSADFSALKRAVQFLKEGKGLVIFPEGGRKNIDSAKPLAGVGFLASKVDVPVIPAFIRGSEEALPRGAKFIKSARVCVVIGKQISIERRMPYQDIAEQVLSNIRHLSC